MGESVDKSSDYKERERERRRLRDRQRRQSMTPEEKQLHLARRRKNYQLRRQRRQSASPSPAVPKAPPLLTSHDEAPKSLPLNHIRHLARSLNDSVPLMLSSDQNESTISSNELQPKRLRLTYVKRLARAVSCIKQTNSTAAPTCLISGIMEGSQAYEESPAALAKEEESKILQPHISSYTHDGGIHQMAS